MHNDPEQRDRFSMYRPGGGKNQIEAGFRSPTGFHANDGRVPVEQAI